MHVNHISDLFRVEGENTDSESDTNRSGKGNYKARNQKPRDNRIEEHKRLDHIEQRHVSGQQNKPKVNYALYYRYRLHHSGYSLYQLTIERRQRAKGRK